MDKVSSRQEYIGPSWSWINPVMKQQYIEWDESTATAACDIIEAESVVEGKNRFGCVQSAHILIRGRSQSLPGPTLYEKIRSGFKRRYWTAGDSGYFTAECELDWYVNEDLEDVMEEEQEEGDDKAYPKRRVLTAASASWLNDLVMLLVGQGSEDKTMNGLLIVRAEKENEWYRVGVFRNLLDKREGKDPLQNWETGTFKLV
ncbi:Heterokaryon incompatibility protein [Lasiodiplodia theobromae]|uniref:Heterokaryon incompatibility protein n=1 Tax=Lasiodiplodia theobromae TaxID=45133 RepID=UPI0015C37468|nr:Heterokaryon incompatibility protein [Lasiodiplodia theobromae]KAF4545962.1 Heterokaryon incompatibility protein [Lasiodiplodia theobromae]